MSVLSAVEGRSLGFDELSPHERVEVQQFGFEPGTSLPGRLGRTGVISTPHGVIETPAFIAVGTKATVKAVLPESLAALGAQAVLANAYHLYLQPGADVVDAAGGLGRFMNWPGPTFTDSGGFQVMCLGAGFKKVLAMDTNGLEDDDVIAEGKTRLAHVDDDGVTFTSHLDGSRASLHARDLDADPAPAGRGHPVRLRRVHHADEHPRLSGAVGRCAPNGGRRAASPSTVGSPASGAAAVPGPVRRGAGRAVRGPAPPGRRDLVSLDIDGSGFDGYGIGGALEKENLGTIVGWVGEELPEDKPRHLLGISEPDDFFTAIENGADTFDCVSALRGWRAMPRSTPADGRFNVNTAPSRRRLRSDRRRLRLLHLRPLHPGVPAPSVQGKGDARLDAVHDPQRAFHRAAGRRHPRQHRGRHLLRLQDRLPGRYYG